MNAAVALISPKYPRNVGNVLRACSNFGAERLVWTGDRVPDPDNWPPHTRLPREERMKLYTDVEVDVIDNRVIDWGRAFDYTPVAVEVRENAEKLTAFEHPESALYVFGPEDGELGRGILTCCHRFVVIPTTSCLNLAAAVNVVLYDRLAKEGASYRPHQEPVYAGVEG